MEYSYAAYTKTVNNKLYFFVKKYICYSEIQNAPDILESYGMHTNFEKACSIAGVKDANLMQQLFAEAMPAKIQTTVIAPVIPILSKNYRVEQIGNQAALVSKLSGIKKSLTARMPQWLLASNS